MRRQLLLFFSALFLLFSCKDKTAGNVIEKEKMAHMLAEVHIVDGTLVVYGAKDSLYKYGANRYMSIFKKYGVDSAAFKKSLKYYAGVPDDMIAIYNRVDTILKVKIDSITKVQAKIVNQQIKQLEKKRKAESKLKADSLRRDSIKQAETIKLKLKRRII